MANCPECKTEMVASGEFSEGTLMVCLNCGFGGMYPSQTRVVEQRNEADDAGQKSPSCLPTQHSWKEEYYGYKCERCQMFIPYGSEPWLPVDE